MHLEANCLTEKLQSVYRKHQLTETALTFVTDEILIAFVQKKSVLLVLLNLPAAFNMVDHAILLKQLLNPRIGLEEMPSIG